MTRNHQTSAQRAFNARLQAESIAKVRSQQVALGERMAREVAECPAPVRAAIIAEFRTHLGDADSIIYRRALDLLS